MPKPSVPRGLCEKAQKLWRETVAVYDLRADELRLLEDACREVDLVEAMVTELRGAPLIVRGSMGQDVEHPLLGEIRQHRVVLARLLKQLDLPDEEEPAGQGAAGDRSASMRSVAEARWRRGA